MVTANSRLQDLQLGRALKKIFLCKLPGCHYKLNHDTHELPTDRMALFTGVV